jgi:DNA-binding CsgD family transcriptional regulator
MAVGGPDDAASHFTTVLELVARPGVPVPDGVDVGLLVSRTAEALVASGQPGRAMALVRDHLDRGPAAPAGFDRARLLLVWAGAALLTETADDPTAATSEALALAGEEPGRLRTRALSLHARALGVRGREEKAAVCAGEALAMAQRFAMPEVVAEATTTLATLDVRAGDAESGVRALEAVVARAEEEGDTDAEVRGRYHLAYVHLERGRLAEAEELFRRTSAAAAAAGRPWAPYGFDARYHQATTALLRGRWEEALRVADPAGQSPPTDPEALLASVRMQVAAGRGDESALGLLDALRGSWEREGLVALNSAAAAIDLYGGRGDLAAMWAVHDEVVVLLDRIWNPLFGARVRLGALVLGQLAGAAADTPGREREGLREGVDELLAAVAATGRRLADQPGGSGPEGRAWVARAHAEDLRLRWLLGLEAGQGGEAGLLAAWQEAVAAFELFGSPYETARSQARLAAVLYAVGRAGEAAPLLAAARATARDLGAAPLLAELGKVTPERAARGPRRSTDELTPREQEILALVALGRSNGEIARQLFISTKTVSVHVSNILGKLGAAGRTEAAAVARRRGLLV